VNRFYCVPYRVYWVWHLNLQPKFFPRCSVRKRSFAPLLLYNSFLDTVCVPVHPLWFSNIQLAYNLPSNFVGCFPFTSWKTGYGLSLFSSSTKVWLKQRPPKIVLTCAVEDMQQQNSYKLQSSSIHFLVARFYNQRWSQLIRQLVSGTDGGTVPAVAGPEILNELVRCPNYELISCIMSRPAHKFPIKAYRRVNGNFR